MRKIITLLILCLSFSANAGEFKWKDSNSVIIDNVTVNYTNLNAITADPIWVWVYQSGFTDFIALLPATFPNIAVVCGNSSRQWDTKQQFIDNQVCDRWLFYTAGWNTISTQLIDNGGTPPTDTTPPVITILGSNPVSHINGQVYTDAGATALDDTDGNITASIQTVNNVVHNLDGQYLVTYNVTDAAGNPATQATRTVNVYTPSDNPPVITLNGSATVNLLVGDTYTEQGATANDTEDGNITASIVISGSVDTSLAGTYTVTYSVTDSGSNTVSTNRSVVVADVPATTTGDLKDLELLLLATGMTFAALIGFNSGMHWFM